MNVAWRSIGMLLGANILLACIRQAVNVIFLSSLLNCGMLLILMLSGTIARASAGIARAIFFREGSSKTKSDYQMEQDNECVSMVYLRQENELAIT